MGPSMPIDLLSQEAKQGRLKIGCVCPFVTTVRLTAICKSTISTTEADLLASQNLPQPCCDTHFLSIVILMATLSRGWTRLEQSGPRTDRPTA